MLCSREVKTEMRGKAGANIPPGGLCAGRKKVILQSIPNTCPAGGVTASPFHRDR